MNRSTSLRSIFTRRFSCQHSKLPAGKRTHRESYVAYIKATLFLMILALSISASALAQVPAAHGQEVPVIPEGESRTVISPHHFDGGGHDTGGGTSHYFEETGDAHHFSWNGGTSPTTGFTVIKYDFRSQNGFQNFITPDQKIALIQVFGQWSAATGNKLLFARDTLAPATEIINIGTGDLAALETEYVSAPGGVIGLGGAEFDHADHTATQGIAWMDFAETWDTAIGNGNPPGTFDYFTTAAQEVGHALGLGHTDDLAGPDLMDGVTNFGEQTVVSANDIAHIQSIYGSKPFTQSLFTRVGFDTYIIPDNSPLDENPLPNQITYSFIGNEQELAVEGTVIASTVPGSSATMTITDVEISNLSGSPLPTLLTDSITAGYAFPSIGPTATSNVSLNGSYTDTLGGPITGADVELVMGLNFFGVPSTVGTIDPPPFVGPGFPSTPFGGSAGPTQTGPVEDFNIGLSYELDGINDAIVLPNSIVASTTGPPGSAASDFGDAPDSYQTLLVSDGPRYKDGELQRLGNRVDYEPDGQPTVNADGDDINISGAGGPDDEDGVFITSTDITVDVNILRSGLNNYRLRGWLDGDENGIFDHTGNLIIDELITVVPGLYTFNYLISGANEYYSRFRLTWIDDPTGILGGVTLLTDITPGGEFLASNGISYGEVEDYRSVPEPTSLVLLALGGLMLTSRRRQVR